MDPIHAPLAPTATSVMAMKVATKLHLLFTPSTDTREAQGGHSMETNTFKRTLPSGWQYPCSLMKSIRRQSAARDVAAHIRPDIHRNLATEDLIVSEFTV